MSKKKVNPKSNYEIYQSIRRDWGGLNPATRIKDSDKIYSRQKKIKKKVSTFLKITMMKNTYKQIKRSKIDFS